MTESEQTEYERLRAEGRWGPASQFREAERQRLRSSGRTKQQARDESWAAMLAKFPPPAQTIQESAETNIQRIREVEADVFIGHDDDERRELMELAQQPGAWDGRWGDALAWAAAYHQLDVTPARAPSVLAWLLRKLCCADRHRFSGNLFIDYHLRHGKRLQFRPSANEHEAQIWWQMFRDLKYDRIVAEFDEADRRNGQSPTIKEALAKAETDTEVSVLIDQIVDRLATKRGNVTSGSPSRVPLSSPAIKSPS